MRPGLRAIFIVERRQVPVPNDIAVELQLARHCGETCQWVRDDGSDATAQPQQKAKELQHEAYGGHRKYSGDNQLLECFFATKTLMRERITENTRVQFPVGTKQKFGEGILFTSQAGLRCSQEA